MIFSEFLICVLHICFVKVKIKQMLNITSLDIDIGVKMNIAHMLRVRGKLSDVAESLGISRPSLYKYMQLYDKGTTDQIPPDVLNYFNDIASDETKRFELMRMTKCEAEKTDCELLH